MLDEVIKIAKENGAVCIIKMPDWNNCPVWEVSFQNPTEPPQLIGIPTFLIVEDGKVRFLSDDEALKFMHYQNSLETEEEQEQQEQIIML